jgi:benzoyl-CoA reductase/2-hydroxyglutaryl-CoA dehydratase subunit BcrC/BadD/HgdB
MPDIIRFFNATGYGDEASRSLHQSLDDLLTAAKIGQVSQIERNHLREATIRYDTLRRLLRGISARRREKPHLLSNSDLFALFTAAVSLPPELVVECLSRIIEAMEKEESTSVGDLIPGLIYAGCVNDATSLDEVEEAGILLVEDDTCSGRRQFDLSFNPDSPRLYGEILDAFSYRPLCSSLRPVEERFELFYRLLKNHGIEVVVFIEDLCCPSRKGDIEFLRVRLMRSGVDPLVISSADALKSVKEYVRRAGVRK